jgi:pyruvate/2-oxoglutarate dehydrogenase complex dihydrolipoamide dehydrogenase (E3) component
VTGSEVGSEFDVIVIGGGPVGENVADYVVRGGLSAVLVESELLGGECSYWACMPSKALLRTGQAVAAARRLPGVSASFDPAAVLHRRDEIVAYWRDDGQLSWAQGAGIVVLRGHGRVSGERAVTVSAPDGGVWQLRARHAVVVSTGSVPTRPSIPGLDAVRSWSSRGATSAQRVPGRLGVLGGGVVGVEMAQAWARLGSRVTLVVRDERLLTSMEPLVSDLVLAGLGADGVDVRLGSGVESVAPAGSGGAGSAIALRIGAETVEVDEFLIATGRRPNTADVGLDTVGLRTDRALAVDDSGRVPGFDWLYGTGDVTGRAPLTHQGKYAARIAAAAIVARAGGAVAAPQPWSEYAATADHHAVPQVVFTDPEVAFVGRTAERAAADGLPVRTVDLDIAVAGSYLHADGYTGKARMVVDTERDVLVGCTFVGPDTAELLHAATIAVVGEVRLSRLWHAVPAYPTISEIWLRLLEAYRGPSSPPTTAPSRLHW